MAGNRRNAARRDDLQGNLMEGVKSVTSRVDRLPLDDGALHDNQRSGGNFVKKTVRAPAVRKASRSRSE